MAASSASESAPPEQPTSTTWPGARSASARRTASRVPATAGSSRPPTREPALRRRPGRTSARGRRSRRDAAGCRAAPRRRRNRPGPTRSTTPRTNSAPSRYCFIFRSSPSSRRATRSRPPLPLRRWVNRVRSCSTLGTTSGPTPSMTTSACPSSRDITAVTSSTTAFWSGDWTRSSSEASLSPRMIRPSSVSAWSMSWGTSASSRSVVSASRDTCPRRWSPSHGTPPNCSRCVSSCRQTHIRKSCGSASSSRSACTMLGATSSSRPAPPPAKGSNCPSTLCARNASSPPTSSPVTREPTARAQGVTPLTVASRSSSGSARTAKPSTLACTHRARSTTSTGVRLGSASSPVKLETCSRERAAARRSPATASSASSAETTGPGRTSDWPALTARSQSMTPRRRRPGRRAGTRPGAMATTVRAGRRRAGGLTGPPGPGWLSARSRSRPGRRRAGRGWRGRPGCRSGVPGPAAGRSRAGCRRG